MVFTLGWLLPPYAISWIWGSDDKYAGKKDFTSIPNTIQCNKYYHLGTYNVLQKFKRGIKSAVREGMESRQACRRHCLSKSEIKEVKKVISNRGNMMFSDSGEKKIDSGLEVHKNLKLQARLDYKEHSTWKVLCPQENRAPLENCKHEDDSIKTDSLWNDPHGQGLCLSCTLSPALYFCYSLFQWIICSKCLTFFFPKNC